MKKLTALIPLIFLVACSVQTPLPGPAYCVECAPKPPTNQMQGEKVRLRAPAYEKLCERDPESPLCIEVIE